MRKSDFGQLFVIRYSRVHGIDRLQCSRHICLNFKQPKKCQGNSKIMIPNFAYPQKCFVVIQERNGVLYCTRIEEKTSVKCIQIGINQAILIREILFELT